MKKNMLLAAAATLLLGMTACTDEPIILGPEVSPEVATTPMVKSTSDLVGTNWTYTLIDDTLVFDEDTLVMNVEFGLNFDANYAHLTFPEDMVMLTVNSDFTVEEVQGMNFAYTYELATTSGTLTATDNDITGETINMQLPFRYDAATDGILIDLQVAYEGSEDTPETITLVFHRG